MGGFNANAANSAQDRERFPESVSTVTAARNEIQSFSISTPPQLVEGLTANFGSAVLRLWDSLAQCFSANDQPQVKWWRDAQGQDHYSVYDPHRQQTHKFATAHEVRVWLEQRYYE